MPAVDEKTFTKEILDPKGLRKMACKTTGDSLSIAHVTHLLLMKRSDLLPSAFWVSSQAGSSLFLASSAWMVSGLTPSPLINSLIPVATAIPILINIKERLDGYWLQVASILALLAFSWLYADDAIGNSALVVVSFLSIFSYCLGIEFSNVSLQKNIISKSNIRLRLIQICTEIGSLVGAILTALIFPAVSQFIPAFVLVLPLALYTYKAKAKYIHKIPDDEFTQSSNSNIALNPLCFLQGFVLGGLFAVLALWVRVIDGGKCFDFGVILACYFLGKGLVEMAPKFNLRYMYMVVFSLLIACQLMPLKWISALLFIPIGMFINSTDLSIASALSEKDKLVEGWKSFQDQSALGGIAGGLTLGSICQVIGIEYALPIVSSGFVLLSILSTKSRIALKA